MSTNWSVQQTQIFDWFANGTGNLVVRARAGTGKTTTILEAINHAPEQRIMLCAFNKKIADELTRRLQNPRAESKTLHSIGFAGVRRWWPDIRVASPDRLRGDSLTQAVCGDSVPEQIKRLVSKLHGKAREITPLASQLGELLDLADQFDCEPDEEWEDFGYNVDVVERLALAAMVRAAEKKPVETGIDFPDMIYLPIRNKWLRPQYDLVVVDEAQDMTAAQLLMARGICAGRIVVVGDDRQAIYGFRGASSDALDTLKTELNASELGLNTTYRCGRNIVAHAARIVIDFFCHPSAHEGEVRHIGHEAMIAEAAPGDFCLSRKNAPLASVAMALIRAHKRCVISGKDIGAGLIGLTDKLANGNASHSVPAFLEKLANWQDREITRAVKARKDEKKIEQIRDKAETLAVLAEGVVGVPELRSRLAELFTDTSNPATVVTCSSVHKAKGLEADRVYLLVDTLYPKLPKGVSASPARQIEEANIEYVACTRAKNVLVLVSSLTVALSPPPEAPAFLMKEEVLIGH